ncbi:MAG: DUF4262 domain-containing protein [Bacteroidetes bacterium]|jgi:hypothetical protein|nr:DUF4262 domain-containing protein [Bacteroidota bacterium]
MVDKETNSVDQKLLEDIEKHGLHVLHILGEEDFPPFSYSVGLYKNYNHPEIIIIGLKQQLGHIIINNIAEDIKNGIKYDPFSWSDNILDDYKCLFIPVDKSNYEEYVGYDRWYYKGDNFPLLQCIYPTTKGIYPWEDAWPDNIKKLQPSLGPINKP